MSKTHEIINIDQFHSIADAMRAMLMDNPCVLADNSDKVYHFSDEDLENAFLVTKRLYDELNA